MVGGDGQRVVERADLRDRHEIARGIVMNPFSVSGTTTATASGASITVEPSGAALRSGGGCTVCAAAPGTITSAASRHNAATIRTPVGGSRTGEA